MVLYIRQVMVKKYFHEVIEELLKELKEYRNELVSKNYPFQRISNLIVKYDDKVAEEKKDKKDD